MAVYGGLEDIKRAGPFGLQLTRSGQDRPAAISSNCNLVPLLRSVHRNSISFLTDLTEMQLCGKMIHHGAKTRVQVMTDGPVLTAALAKTHGQKAYNRLSEKDALARIRALVRIGARRLLD